VRVSMVNMGVNRGLFWRVSMVTMGLLECTCHVLHDVSRYLHCLVRDSTTQKAASPLFFVVYRGLFVRVSMVNVGVLECICQIFFFLHAMYFMMCHTTCIAWCVTRHQKKAVPPPFL